MTSGLSIYYYNMGLAYLKRNYVSTAMENLKKAVYWDPGNHIAWNLLGLSYYRAGQIPMAKHCWLKSEKNSKIVELSSDLQPDGSYYLSLLENGRNDAITNLSKVIELAEQGEYKASLQQFNLSTSSTNNYNNSKSINRTNSTSIDGFTKENSFESPQLLSYIGILEYLSKNKRQARAYWFLASQLDKSDKRPIRYLECTEKRASWLTKKLKTIWLTINKGFRGKVAE